MMTIAFGAFRAGRATPRAPAGLGHSATITASLRRVQAMSAAWDRAAEALRCGDFAACDEALTQFRSILEGREGQLKKRLPTNQ